MNKPNEQDSKQTPKMPFWVLLAFSSIQKRKHALILIWSCILFSVYCLPWVKIIDSEIIATLFLIDDWSWIVMMIPLSIWYIMSLRWMDANQAWEQPD